MTDPRSAAERHHLEALAVEQEGHVVDKGLKGGAVSMVASTAVGIASTAPAYSLAATIGFVVAVVGLQTPLLVVLAFIPMFFSAWATKEMNRADPDCGTSFTWAARVLGPRTGWFAGGWGTIAADLLAMASYAQVAGQYVFLLVGADSIGTDPTSVWVLLTGIGWIVLLTYLCWRGIEVSASIQVALAILEVAMLVVLSVVALVKVADGTAPAGHLTPSLSWFDPTALASFNAFMVGMLLMVFIYWGWDTTTSINEETEDPASVPGNAGVLSTFLLLATYLLVVISVQSFAGTGTKGIGLGNTEHQGDVISVLGSAVFGSSALGWFLSHMLILMVLTSAAATTQTTILPNARTTLSMAFHKALPPIFGRVHPRHMTPSFSTIAFGVVSIVYYTILNFVSGGSVIADAVTATSIFAALYLGVTAVACTWHYRAAIYAGARKTVSQIVVPALAAVMLFGLLGWSIKVYLDPEQSEFAVSLPLLGEVGGVLLVTAVTVAVGLGWMAWCELFTNRTFFRGRLAWDVSITEDDRVVAAGGSDPQAAPGGEAA